MDRESQVGPAKHDDEVASPAEVRDAMERLSGADHAKLMRIAQHFERVRLSGTTIDAEELFHEAILKTLDGRRRWNKSVSFIKHLDRVMESESGHIVEKRALHDCAPLPDGAGEPAIGTLDPESYVVELDELKHALAVFAGDEIALKILYLRSDGFSASEIQQELGIDRTQFESATKRIRRWVAKYLAGGGS